MALKILIINPNSTSSMTRDIEVAANRKARKTTYISAVNPIVGPASIQGREDGEACLPGLFELFDLMVTDTSLYDAVIIACFDDTGVSELKARANIPVIGIGEAAFHAASILGQSFSTVTTLSVSIPVIQENIERYGFSQYSKRVRASEVAVLDVGCETASIIGAEARKAIEEDQCDVVVLGCAGMADLAMQLSIELGHPVVEGVAAAVGLCEALVEARAQ